MLYSVVYTANHEILTNVDPQALAQLVQNKDNLIWLDLEDPTRDELKMAGRLFNLLPLTLEDMGPSEERSKIESYQYYIFLVLHAVVFDEKKGLLATPEVDFAFGHSFLVSTHYVALPNIFDSRKWEYTVEEVLSQGCDFLLYVLTDRLVDSYFPELDKMDDAIDELQDSVITNPTDAVLARIFEMKKNAFSLRKVTFPQLEVFTRITTRNGGIVSENHLIYFRDVHDHLYQVYEVVDSYRDLMSGALDAYLSTVSNRLNDVMKRLTTVATIFLPITAISSILGMNVGFMPQVSWDPGYFFWLIIAFLTIVTAAQIAYFRRKGWM